MSEALESEVLKALEEVPNSSELYKVTTLQDIPLAESSSMNEDLSERKLKTNSLKKFFRFSSKKEVQDDPLETGESEINFEKDKAQNIEELAGSISKTTLKASLGNYWNSMFRQKKVRKSGKSKSELQSTELEASSSMPLENLSPKTPIEFVDSVCKKEEDIVQSLEASLERT